MLRKNELVSEVKGILLEVVGYDFNETEYAQKIVDRVLALIQKEPDANKR